MLLCLAELLIELESCRGKFETDRVRALLTLQCLSGDGS
jgi:hypothetical protein